MKLLTEQHQILITETYRQTPFIDIYFSKNKIEKQNPINRDFKLDYKVSATLIFNVSGKYKKPMPSSKDIKTIKDKFKREILETRKFKEMSFEEFFNSSIYSGNLSDIYGSRNWIKILSNPKLKNFDYSKRGHFYFADIEYHLQFNLLDWFWFSLKNDRNVPNLFFKKYVILYKYDPPPIIKFNTYNWKELLTKAFLFGIKNNSKIKQYFKEITKINPNNTTIELKLFASERTFKITNFGWLTKLIMKFGIPRKYAKLMSTGISIFAAYKIFKYITDEEEKAKMKRQYEKLKDFLLH